MAIPSIQAKDKLMESAFFLNELENSLGVEARFRYYLSAFLTATYSVLDILLYDFAEKLGFPFTREEFVGERDFFVASKVSGSKEGIEFLRWLQRQKAALAKNPLWEKRKFTVHRGTFGMDHDFSVTVSGTSSAPAIGTSVAVQYDWVVGETSIPVMSETKDSVVYSTNRPGGSGNNLPRPLIVDKEDLRALHDQVADMLAEAEAKFWRQTI